MIKIIYISFISVQITKEQTISAVIDIYCINSCLQNFNITTA